MNCLDCTLNDRPSAPAIAVCVTCSAGVCVTCARVKSRPVPHPATVENPNYEQIRTVTCVSCDAVLNHNNGLSLTACENAIA